MFHRRQNPLRTENTCREYSGSAWSPKIVHPPDAAAACTQPSLEAVRRAHIGHQCHVIEDSTRWTKYTTKGTDGSAENWVSGSRSGWHAAFTWLTRCQHSTAQMVATLTRTPLVRYSCRTKVILVPTPNDAVTNDLVRKNLSCCLRSADIREYRCNIEAPRPYEVKVRGGSACAFQVTSFYKDSYFGQWLVMNVPANMTSFRNLWFHGHAVRRSLVHNMLTYCVDQRNGDHCDGFVPKALFVVGDHTWWTVLSRIFKRSSKHVTFICLANLLEDTCRRGLRRKCSISLVTNVMLFRSDSNI